MAFSEGSGQNTSSSTSSSTPVSIRTPENDMIDQIAATAAGLAPQMLNWANQEYQRSSDVTEQSIGNFFRTSQQMAGLSDDISSQYRGTVIPNFDAMAKEANSYNSKARQQVDMGMAGATAAQTGEQAIRNAQEGLRSYGLNPADGKYAALDKAARVTNAANIAGQMNLQRDRDIQIGQALRGQVAQIGATMPAASANAATAGTAANSAASNARLALNNTGVNMYGLPNNYLSTAMQIKLPPTGQNSNSASEGQGTNKNVSSSPDGSNSSKANFPDASKGGGASSPGSHNSGSSGGSAWMPDHGGAGSFQSGGGGGGMVTDGNGDFNAGDMTFDYGTPNDSFPVTDWNGDGNMTGSTETTGNGGWDNGYGGSYSDYEGGAGGDAIDYGGGTYNGGGGEVGGGMEYFAGGGAIDESLSPSGGRQVDDVAAQGPQGQQLRMNAGEFVVPEDVARFKGEEFFQKLIAQSRKARATAPAHPQRR